MRGAPKIPATTLLGAAETAKVRRSTEDAQKYPYRLLRTLRTFDFAAVVWTPRSAVAGLGDRCKRLSSLDLRPFADRCPLADRGPLT